MTSTGTGERAASAATAAASPRSVSTAGWMPRASSRSSAEASCSSRPSFSRNAPDLGRVLGQPPARDLDVEHERDEPLLGAVVEVALDLAPGVVGGLDDAGARGAQLGGPGRLDLVAQQRLLGLRGAR